MINNIGGSGKGMRTVCLRVEKCRNLSMDLC